MEPLNNDNNKESNNSDSSKNSKILEFKLKPVKVKENFEYKYFNKLTDVLIAFNLLPFLKENEVKTSGCLDIKFYNAFIRFCEDRYNSLNLLYNINLNNNKGINQNELYEQKDDKGHYIKLGVFSVEHYSLFANNNWPWKEDKRYWNKIEAKNTILNREIYNLIMVCWVDVNQTITHVFYGKYKLYLNHCICNLDKSSLKLKIFLDKQSIFETDYPTQEQKNRCRDRHVGKDEEENNNNRGLPPRRGNPLFRGLRIPLRTRYKVELKEKRVDKDLITEIDIPYDEKIDKDKGHIITVRFGHNNSNWKQGWMIDAFILEKEL